MEKSVLKHPYSSSDNYLKDYSCLYFLGREVEKENEGFQDILNPGKIC